MVSALTVSTVGSQRTECVSYRRKSLDDIWSRVTYRVPVRRPVGADRTDAALLRRTQWASLPEQPQVGRGRYLPIPGRRGVAGFLLHQRRRRSGAGDLSAKGYSRCREVISTVGRTGLFNAQRRANFVARCVVRISFDGVMGDRCLSTVVSYSIADVRTLRRMSRSRYWRPATKCLSRKPITNMVPGYGCPRWIKHSVQS